MLQEAAASRGRMRWEVFMKFALASLFAVLASSVTQAAWGLKFEVSPDGGATWTNAVNALPGQTIAFRFGGYFDVGTKVTTADGTGNAMALNRFTGSNQFTNFGMGDMFQNLVRTATSGAQSITGTSGGTIGTTAISSFAGQLLLTLPSTPETYYQIYRGEIKVSSANFTPRVLTFKNKTFGSGSTKGLTFYHDASAANKQSGQPDEPRTDLEASIHVIPTPSSLAVLGVAGVLLRRRR
jgi:uncharacterized protein (TIGR03382 family)